MNPFETRVTEFLEANNVVYKLLPHEKQVFTCEEAAKERHVPLSEMVKCILLVDKQKKYLLACIPADKMLDTKKAKMFFDSYSRLSFASEREVEEVTGYKMGAVPPLLLKLKIPIIFEQSIQLKEKVNISSGNPSAGIELKPRDLLKLVEEPLFGNIVK